MQFGCGGCDVAGNWNTFNISFKDICNWIMSSVVIKEHKFTFDLFKVNKNFNLNFRINQIYKDISNSKMKADKSSDCMKINKEQFEYSLKTFLAWKELLHKKIKMLENKMGTHFLCLLNREVNQFQKMILDEHRDRKNTINQIFLQHKKILDILTELLEDLILFNIDGNVIYHEHNHLSFVPLNEKNKSKRILKNIEPTIRTYLGDAFCFSIIDDKAFEEGWIYDKYINLHYCKSDHQIKYKDFDYYEFVPTEGVFIKSFTSIPIEVCNKQLIFDYVIDMINRNEYFFGYWDENIVKNFIFGLDNNKTFVHGCFIYGYDLEKKILYSQGYFNDNWKKITIPFDVFYDAIINISGENLLSFNGYKVIANYSWKFNYARTRKGIEKYLEVGDSDNIYFSNQAGCKMFFDFLKKERNNSYIHIPSVYCLYEQKKIMTMRVTFLARMGYLKNHERLILHAKMLEDTFKIILTLAIKYNIIQDKKTLKEIYQYGIEGIGKEKELIEALKKDYI